ncbi:LemA family protein [Photobacterium leiognathi]|uniref:LemA family protein n=1 Tax=Photobacterium leiognathi TaxID=553611 RepID=UPI000D176E0F|nr:LemA family protein [Photobacterium leiognathi]PSW56549.1 LemA family protein [Photobacterium leiognathi subsp. mandapamensis]
MSLIITIAVIVLLAFIYISLRNGLIGKKNQVANAESSIDVMLKKRFDLLPNLIETAKAYMQHEKTVLTELTELRSQANNATSTDEKAALDKQMSTALSHFRVAVEAYPELKANENIDTVLRSMNEVEAQLSASRRSFNAAVTDFNNAVEMFPSSIIANSMNLKTLPLFEIPEVERQNIDAAALFNNK